MPTVLSESDSEINHPLKDLFLRKLHEKDVAHIGDRMNSNFFEETMVLLNGKSKRHGMPNVQDRISDSITKGK